MNRSKVNLSEYYVISQVDGDSHLIASKFSYTQGINSYYFAKLLQISSAFLTFSPLLPRFF